MDKDSAIPQTLLPSAIERLLQELQSEPRATIFEREKTAFDSKSAPFSNSIILFGAGALGRYTLDGLRKIGIRPLAFSDNNSAFWSKSIDGIEVLPPDDAAAHCRHSACFVVTIYRGSKAREHLHKLDCERVVDFPSLFWKYEKQFIPSSGLELPHRILDQAEDIKIGYSLLHDEDSKREFCAQLRWRVLMDYCQLPDPGDDSHIYFPSDLILPIDDEVLVDCGAFDGDSIRSFLRARRDVFKQIYAVEPDPTNRLALERFRDSLPPLLRARVEIFPYALGSCNKTVSFDSGHSAGSRIVPESGGDAVECRKLDDMPINHHPTYIKMDTEGAEPDAILGAAGILAKCSPVLAACVYHRCEHLWQIPQLVRTISPTHRLLIRRYAEDCWEMVCYAVPPNRLSIDQSGLSKMRDL